MDKYKLQMQMCVYVCIYIYKKRISKKYLYIKIDSTNNIHREKNTITFKQAKYEQNLTD